MGEVVNLRRARKARDRVADAKTADANRIRHGLTKIERVAAVDTKSLLDRTLDGAKRSD